MVYPPATSEAGARRPAIIQLEQFKEASSKPAQLLPPRCLDRVTLLTDKLRAGNSKTEHISMDPCRYSPEN
jgi:hypothetical protein